METAGWIKRGTGQIWPFQC